MNNNKYNTIIFDLDGTLLYTLDALTDYVNYAMKKYGYEKKSKEYVRKCIGNGMRVLLSKCLPSDIDREKFEKIFKDFSQYYIDNAAKNTYPYDDIMDMLEKLKNKGYKLGIVSNKNAPSVDIINEIFFDKYIDVAYGESSDYKRKPAPDLVHKAIKELGTDIDKTLYVGDSLVDYKTACNSGTDCILVTWGFGDNDDLRNCSKASVIDSPSEIFKFLG